MHRIASAFVLAALLFTSGASSAQSYDDLGGDTIGAKTATVLGGSEQVARNMLVAMRLERKQRDLCDEMGCLVIVNESQSFNVTGFFVDGSVKTGKSGWGANQFRTPLLARKATYRVRLDESGVCELPLMFVMRHVTTGEEVRVEGRTNMCRTPRGAALLRLKVVVPTVELGAQEPDRIRRTCAASHPPPFC